MRSRPHAPVSSGVPQWLLLAVLVLAGAGAVLLVQSLLSTTSPAVPGALRVTWDLGQAAPAGAGEPSSVELTVYNPPSQRSYYYSRSGLLEFEPSNGIALVKERRSAELPSGLARLSLAGVAAHLSPGSVRFASLTDPLARVLEQDYDYDLVSAQKILERYVDQTVTVRAENRSYTGKLLATSPVVLQTSEGVKLFNERPEFETLPELPRGLLAKPTLNWLLQTTRAGRHDLELSYLTSGLQWSAEYVALVERGATRLDLNGWVNVANDAGVSFKNARLKLVAGEVNLVQAPQYYPYPYYAEAAVRAAGAPSAGDAAPPQFREQQLFEYRLYSLERATDLASGQSKQIELLAARGVEAKRELVFDSERSDKVRVNVEFENRKSAGIGISLPAGVVRVYQPDDEGKLQFLGEDRVDHTPENEKVRLFIGNALDLTAEREQTEYEQLSRCVIRQGYRVSLRNAKDEAAEVKVVEHAYGDWTIPRESQPHTRESATAFSWRVRLPGKGSAELTYTIDLRYRYC
jgi:hypothetical protein